MLRTTAAAAILAGTIASASEDTFQQSVYTPLSEATTDQVLAEKDTNEVARELLNPNTPLATLTFKAQHVSFKGDIHGAGNQSTMLYTFQPSFPFQLANGDGIFFRPAISFATSQPSIGAEGWSSVTGWSDLSFDLSYGRTFENGNILAGGLFATVPLGGELGSNQFRVGPELIVGRMSQKSVLAGLFTHQWNVGGSNKQDYSVTATQLAAAYLPGNGWSLGTAPLMSYDWNDGQWNVPINVNIAKTVIIGKTPVQIALTADKYVAGADEFGRDTVIGINFSPVVRNVFAGMFN